MIRCDSGADSHSLDVKKARKLRIGPSGQLRRLSSPRGILRLFSHAFTPKISRANCQLRSKPSQISTAKHWLAVVWLRDIYMYSVERTNRGNRQDGCTRVVVPLATITVVIVVWHLLSLNYPAFILPAPAAVAMKFVERTSDGTLPMHIATTAGEALPGLLIGTIIALLLGYPAAHSRWADQLISPLVVATQGVPLIAVAPLIFIWFGSGYGAKVLVCTIIVFFPIIVNVTTGLRRVPTHLHDVFSMLDASRIDRFTKLELPAALPFIFAGLRTAGALSMIGALTGEFLSSNRGLGFLINQATGLYDTALVLAAILSTVATSLAIHAGIRTLERAFVRGHHA